jgi:hypothetical protein
MQSAPNRLVGRDKLSVGLAPTVSYDPWFLRALESIKQSIADGIPALVRLHCGSSYSRDPETSLAHDMESQAVLIVGYDDARRAVKIVDPWHPKMGGRRGGTFWLGYDDLTIEIVDSSRGLVMNLAPLDVSIRAVWDSADQLSLDINAGFHAPLGRVMDRDGWAIKQFDIEIQPSTAWTFDPQRLSIRGHWLVGDQAQATLQTTHSLSEEGEICVQVTATIEGKRPYPFIDKVDYRENLKFCASNKGLLASVAI